MLNLITFALLLLCSSLCLANPTLTDWLIDGDDDTLLTAWQSWSECSVICGGGDSISVRQCLSEWGGCSGKLERRRKCNAQPCKVEMVSLPGVWLEWGAWSRCSVTCGPGVRVRTRTCETPGEGACTGSTSQTDNSYCSLPNCQSGEIPTYSEHLKRAPHAYDPQDFKTYMQMCLSFALGMSITAGVVVTILCKLSPGSRDRVLQAVPQKGLESKEIYFTCSESMGSVTGQPTDGGQQHGVGQQHGGETPLLHIPQFHDLHSDAYLFSHLPPLYNSDNESMSDIGANRAPSSLGFGNERLTPPDLSQMSIRNLTAWTYAQRAQNVARAYPPF